MSEPTDNRDGAEAAADTRGPLAGERLAEARRKQQITVLEVAKELHLDELKVRALEQNNFDALGAPVFAKGHLRKYAQLVGVSMDDLLSDYYELNRTSGMPPVVGKVRKQAREMSPGPWVAATAVIIVVATTYWYFVVRDVAQTAAPEDSINMQAVEVEPAPVLETPIKDAQTQEDSSPDDVFSGQPVELPDPGPVEAESQPVDEAVTPQVAAQLADGDVRLSIRFSGDCWTEITDAGGRRLYFGLGRDGRNVDVTGRGPLSVLFGNAQYVSVSVNGEDYPIAASNRRGRTARLTINAP